MNVDPRQIAPHELRFMQLYAITLKKNYDEFYSAIQLMRDETGVSCICRAAELARQLQRLHGEFDHSLALIANQHNAPDKKLPPYPPLELVSRLLRASFFKLVEKKKDDAAGFVDKGWCSGHPVFWEDAIKNGAAADLIDNSPLSAIMHAFLKLLGGISAALGTEISEFPKPAADSDDFFDDDASDDESNWSDF